MYGDCSFLSALSGAVRTRGFAWLTDTIREVRGVNGQLLRYEVRFFDETRPDLTLAQRTHWEPVSIPSAALRMQHGSASDGSLWVTVYEIAYLQYRVAQEAAAGVAPGMPRIVNLQRGSYMQNVVTGEFQAIAIRRLTGEVVTQQAMPNNNLDLLALLNETRIVTIATPAQFLAPGQAAVVAREGIVANHAYTYVGFENGPNGETRYVLRNPWNNPTMAGGNFVRLSITELRTVFSTIARN